MTREEQIKEAARQRADQYDHPSKWSDTYYGFIDGSKWADSHPQWIPVEERLPETIDWYLCYNDLEDGCEVLHWEGDGNVWIDNDWHYKSKEVTHWMEIVPPRKED